VRAVPNGPVPAENLFDLPHADMTEVVTQPVSLLQVRLPCVRATSVCALNLLLAALRREHTQFLGGGTMFLVEGRGDEGRRSW